MYENLCAKIVCSVYSVLCIDLCIGKIQVSELLIDVPNALNRINYM